MTGYGKAMAETPKIKGTCEIKSLNGRYMEIDLRLPKYFSQIDPLLRNLISQNLQRGTVTIYYNFEFLSNGMQDSQLAINEDLAAAYLVKLRKLSEKLQIDFIDPFRQILQIPDVMGTAEREIDEDMQQFVLQLTELALKNLIEFRKTEGRNICTKLTEAIVQIETELKNIELEEPNRNANLKERIYNNLAEHVQQNSIDPMRLEQEILLYLDKWDITEEKNRLQQHLKYFRTTLEQDAQGRKLNFIAQEMGREINTLGVKSNHFPIQQATVKMKENLEQLKEQILNIV